METKLHYLLPCRGNEEKTCLNELLSYTFSILIEPSGGQLTSEVFPPPIYNKFNWSHQVKRFFFCGDASVLKLQPNTKEKEQNDTRVHGFHFLIPNLFMVFCVLWLLSLLVVVVVVISLHLRTLRDLHLRPITAFIWCVAGSSWAVAWPGPLHKVAVLTKLWLPTLQMAGPSSQSGRFNQAVAAHFTSRLIISRIMNAML